MRFNWLESKVAYILFFCSAAAFSIFCFFAFSLAVPAIRQFLNSSSANNYFGGLFFALGALAAPSMLIVFFGMVIFCVSMDHSSIGRKAWWFVLFLVAGPFGTTVYFFVVYRRQIKKDHGQAQISKA